MEEKVFKTLPTFEQSQNSKKQLPHGHVRRQISVGLVTNIIAMTGGITLIVSAMVLPQISDDESTNNDGESLRLNTEEGSWFASLYSIGIITGSLVGGLQSDYMGRKSSMMLDSILMSVGFFSIALATSFPMLLFGRFLGGHATGSSLVSLPVYIGEISHPHLRGAISGMFGFFNYFGTFLVSISSALVPWRTAMGLMGCIPLINLFGFIFCPESPTWLLRFNKHEKALKSMTFLRGDINQAQDAIESIKANLMKEKKLEHDKPTSLSTSIKLRGKGLLESSFLKPFFLLLFLIAFVQVWSGTAFINFYMVTFFEHMKIPIDPYLISATLSLYRMVLGFFGVSIIASIKRRIVYITLSSCIFFANSSLAIHQFLLNRGYFHEWGINEHGVVTFFPLFSIAFLYGSFAMGFGSIARTIQGELLPADKRSIGVGIIGILEGISVFIIAKIAPLMIKILKIEGCFVVFALVAVSAATVSYTLLPETKGRTLEDIENHYRKSFSKSEENK